MNNKNPILKTIIISLIVLTTFAAIRTVSFYVDTKKMFLENAKKDATLMKDYMMSVREVYQKQFLESGIILDKTTLGFLPAHALGEISSKFILKNQEGFYIRNVSENPRNPNNKADREEIKAIDFFKRDKNATEYFQKYEKDGIQTYQFATPIKIKARCLACHGKKEETLTGIQKLYNNSYNYKVGNIKGVVSIKIPQSSIDSKLNDFILKEIFFTLISITLIYITLITLYKKTSNSIRQIEKEATDYALTDALTGLKNRHYLKMLFNEYCYEFATGHNKRFAVAFIDIDHFKKINDTFGHDVGDCVLQEFANKLQNSIREEDVLCRYGGEEFLLILTNTTKASALQKLEKLRIEVEKSEYSCLNEKLSKLTISIGVSFNKLDKTLKQSIKEADKAVYKAKSLGRNQVSVFNEGIES